MTTTAERPTAPAAATPTIFQAMAAVMTDVTGVGKHGRNTQQNFSFRGIDDVLNAVGPALRAHGVFLAPCVGDYSAEDVEVGAKKTPMKSVTLTVSYTFYGPAGDSVTVTVPGEAMDSGDKPLALDTPIPTPSGWTTMGLLEVGDTVFDMNGEPCQVISTSEVKHDPCMRISLRNGNSIVATRDHDWWACNGRNTALRVWTTEQLAQRKAEGAMVTLPASGPLVMDAAPLPLDPWFLGYWLGDGTTGRPQVTCGTRDEPHVREMISSAGLQVTSVSVGESGAPRLYVSGIKKTLADLGVLADKRIPAEYLRSSTAQRLALLRGLMDSDGCGSGDKALFVSTNPGLAGDVAELVRSLGETPNRWSQPAYGFGVTATAHRVAWRPALNPFALARKVEQVKMRKRRHFHSIISIEEVDAVPTRCIRVSSPTQSFLCGRSMVPTHNCVSKAMSVALRTALIQTFALPTNEKDPDTDVYERAPRELAPQRPPQNPQNGNGQRPAAQNGQGARSASPNDGPPPETPEQKLTRVVGRLLFSPDQERVDWWIGKITEYEFGARDVSRLVSPDVRAALGIGEEKLTADDLVAYVATYAKKHHSGPGHVPEPSQEASGTPS